MGNDYYVVYVTVPRGKGRDLARTILEERLAACVNITPVESMYWWQGKIEEDREDLLVVKTKGKALKKLISRVREIHPYSVPEVIAVPIVEGNPAYLEWVEREVVD
ncbi:MAG: divalent-cation tolerance protein CutA [Desulfurococcales archaeon]|nr:divalent-cation tolerance protein CutA [Desulfurococcales archaeon]